MCVCVTIIMVINSFFKFELGKLSHSVPEDQARDILINRIDEFIKERIEFADQVIAKRGNSTIVDGDVIMTYGR